MANGKILVLEGTDFSGKTTQFEKLKEKLWSMGIDVASESFPNYQSDSSYFVKEYLGGSYGVNAKEINPKAASLFYTLDRFDTFHKGDLGKVYRAGGNILLARYITSNILHQASKYKTEAEVEEFIEWLYEMETGVYGIPKEDKVIFLDLHYNYIEGVKKVRDKENKGLSSAGLKKDIHEDNPDHIIEAYKTAKYIANKCNWHTIECVRNEERRSVEDIHEEILKIAIKFFEGK